MSEIKAEDVFNFLGVKDIEDLDGFKEVFNKDFVKISALGEREDITKPIVDAAFGKTAGTIETEVKRLSKGFGSELGTDFDSLNIVDKVRKVNELVLKSHTEKVTDLESKLGAGDSDKVKSLTTDVETFKGKYEEQKGLTTSAQDALSTA